MPGGFYVMKSDAAGWPPWEEFNADGLRDRTRPHEKPDGVRRVVVLGDSVTLGAQIRRDQAFPQLLEARLAAAGRPIEVMNVALWGWSTRQERIAWEPDRARLPSGCRDPGRLPERHPGAAQQPRPPATLAHGPARSLRRGTPDRERAGTRDRQRRAAVQDAEAPSRPRGARSVLRRGAGASSGGGEGRRVVRGASSSRSGSRSSRARRIPSCSGGSPTFCGAERLRCLDLLPVLAPLGRSAFVDYDHLSPSGAAATAEAVRRSELLPRADAAPELLRRAIGNGAGRRDRRCAGWPSEGQPLPPAGARALAAALSAADAPTRVAAAWALARAGVRRGAGA